jgi:hypothetical protein
VTDVATISALWAIEPCVIEPCVIEPWVIETVVPCGVRHGFHTSAELFGERLDDDRAQSRTWLLDEPRLALRSFPIPLSETASRQPRYQPPHRRRQAGRAARSPTKACLNALITSSVTMRPMLTASADEAGAVFRLDLQCDRTIVVRHRGCQGLSHNRAR